MVSDGAAAGGDPARADRAALEAAAGVLRSGGVVAVPTDTVYGVAALAGSPEGCAALFRLKGRPPTVALPVLVADLEAALALAAPVARPRLAALARRWWPGPLTVVVEAAQPVPQLGGDGLTVGLRCPDDPVVTTLCRRVGPLAVTSANAHGEPPCTTAEEVRAAFRGGLSAVLDGGRRAGVPSTVVSVVAGEVAVLRSGSVGEEAVRSALAPLREGEVGQ